MKQNNELQNSILMICLPISTLCLLFLVCQIALMNPRVNSFYNGFWKGFWDNIHLKLTP